MKSKTEKEIEKLFDESISTLENSKNVIKDIIEASKIIDSSFNHNGKVIAFGNGGSAADAQHFVAEFIGRFEKERKSLPAVAFTTDTSILTAIGNDYSFDKIFERQCESLVGKNDVILAISTSGRSKNILKGVKMAKKKGAKIIGLTGKTGNELKKLSNVTIQVPSKSTPRIQEVHRLILHLICNLVEKSV